MARPRILNVEPEGFAEQARAILRDIGELHEETCGRKRLAALLPETDVLLLRFGHRIDADLLAVAGDRLKIIACPATGTEHIDHLAAQARGIDVLSLKGDRAFLERVTATAELAWGLMLAAVRKMPQARDHVRAGGWDRDRFQGVQLRDKTLGIVGYGRLGRMVARYAQAFGMSVLYADPHVVTDDSGIERVDLHDLVARADIVSLHPWLDDSTHGLIDGDIFATMKPGAVLINTARGEIVDEAALLRAFDDGTLAAAALDVLAGEGEKPDDWPAGNPVWQRAQTDPRVLITPHIGGKTTDSNLDAEIHMAHKIAERAVSSGNPPDPESGTDGFSQTESGCSPQSRRD